MVPGIVELIPFLFDVVLTVCKFLGNDKTEKHKSDFKSNLGRAKSLLKEMEPIIEREKELLEGALLVYLEQLMRKVKDGKQLVRRIEGSHKEKAHKYHNQELQEWIKSFEISLSCAMVGIFAGMASTLEQIKQLLPLHLETTQIHLHLNMRSFPAHQQLSLEKGEDCKVALQKFIDLGGLDPLLQELDVSSEAVSVSKDNADKWQKENVHILTKKENRGNELESVSTGETLDEQPPKRKRTDPSAEEDNRVKQSVSSNKKLKMPKNNMRKVVLAVLARDGAGKRIVERSAGSVKGVISAERVERPNEEKDLVIVKGTKDLVVEDITKYLKRELKRKYVDVISDELWEEEGG